AGMDHERRSLRLAVRDLRWRREAAPDSRDAERDSPEAEPGAPDAEQDSIVLEFRLTRGAYATTVLREVFALDADYDESST
ncbi:MAG TPA: hypothetical protein VGR92_08930, partial [Steroidobacteraceae bacterium]|nr:hypothetical protein [Steroidobacteraceae bacterium]